MTILPEYILLVAGGLCAVTELSRCIDYASTFTVVQLANIASERYV